jgi:archaellum component FlaC
MTAGAFTATLKGKINGLEETIKALQEELHFYKKEIQTLRSEKETLDDTLTRKA